MVIIVCVIVSGSLVVLDGREILFGGGRPGISPDRRYQQVAFRDHSHSVIDRGDRARTDEWYRWRLLNIPLRIDLAFGDGAISEDVLDKSNKLSR